MVPEGWKTVRIGDIAQVKGGKRMPKGRPFAEGKTLYPYIRVSNFDNGTVNTEFLKYVLPDDREKIKSYTISHKDLYISIAGTIGLVGTVSMELDGAQLTENAAKICFKSQTNFERDYIKYVLSSTIGKSQIDTAKGVGGGVPKLAIFRIENINVPLPPLLEQKKIAAILSSVDYAIQATQAVIDQTHKVKQGLLQQLLTRGIGHTRFKQTEIGEIPEKWDVVKIKDACYVNKQSIKSSTDKNYEINYIDIASIEYTGCNPERKKMLLKEAPSRARRVVNCSNILVSTVRPNLRGFTFIENAEDNLVCSTGFAVLESKDHYSSRYIYQFVLSDLFLKQVSQKLVGSNYPAINNDDLENVKIIVPDTIEEQKKIAQILSEIDSQLECNKNYLFSIQKIKRGLMQDLLTGRVRVKLDREATT